MSEPWYTFSVKFLELRHIGFLSPGIQISLIILLFLGTLYVQRQEYEKTGKTYGRYPWRISTFLSSTYEEIIFRGLVLYGLSQFISIIWAIIVSSILFGLWHIKNYKWQTKKQTIHQVIYTGVIFGPVASVITIWAGSIWVAVIFHYLHNLAGDRFRKFF